MADLLPFDDPITTREIGQHLRRMMASADVSITMLAQRLGISERAVECWCNGRNLQRTAEILGAFEALGCRVIIAPPGRPKRTVRLGRT